MGQMRCSARIRHPGVIWDGITLEAVDTGDANGALIRAYFEHPIKHVAPLQSVAFYDGEVCLGGAQIIERGPTLLQEEQALRSGSSSSAPNPVGLSRRRRVSMVGG